jgi:hypothetical protein
VSFRAFWIAEINSEYSIVEHPLSRTSIMQFPTFIDVHWDLNRKKLCTSTRGPKESVAPCHSIIGILLIRPCMLRYLASGLQHICINCNGTTLIYNALEIGKKGGSINYLCTEMERRLGQSVLVIRMSVWSVRMERGHGCRLDIVPSPIACHKM